MTDTHSHIYGEEFSSDVDEVIQRAKDAGVTRILLPNINTDSIEPMLCLCERYPSYLFPLIGLHPEDVKQDWQQVLHAMEALLFSPNRPYVGIGEVGLDYYWDKTFQKEQQQALDTQIQWAIRLNLPLVIHCREAYNDLIHLLEPYRNEGIKGIFHCFTGNEDEAKRLLSFEGFVLGIGGVLTFKKSSLPQTLAQVPLSRIVVETDAPYLAPVPYRGKRNESAYCIEVFKFLSTLYKLPLDEIIRQTDVNVDRVFALR